MFGAIGDRERGSRSLACLAALDAALRSEKRDRAGGKRERDSEAGDGGKAKRRLD